ncbi:MAG: hypothetical protein ACO39X_08010, partial [Candidatus Nanopelagicaceae bacterium]
SFARFVSYEEALTLCGFDFEKHLKCLEDYEYYWSIYGPGSSAWDEGFGEYVVKFLKLVDPKLLEGKIPSREEAKKKAKETSRKSEAQNLLLTAIRQRDAKAEAKRLAAEKKERELQENHKKLTDFLYEIGDFVVPCDWSSKVIGDMWTVRDGIRIILRDLDGSEIVLVLADGFEKNSQRIIKWAVDLGAKEPEPAILRETPPRGNERHKEKENEKRIRRHQAPRFSPVQGRIH